MRQDEYAAHDGLGLAALVRKGEVTPRELLELAIARANAVEPVINAIPIRLDERARAEASSGPPAGPFQGVPFLIKDLHLQIAGTPTTNGCALFRDALASFDSTLVERYRDAGLVTFGRSASPEFGLTTTTESALFGATRNPWNPERIAGGSSGGAAAAVAAGVVPLANASDGGGSIRIPAACCGLFGLKPTRMRTPVGPERAEGWNGMTSIHAVSRSVRDSAALLDATAGAAPGDPYCAPPIERPYLEEVGRDPGSLRIALMREPLGGTRVDPAVLDGLDRTARLCESLGHRVEEASPALDTRSIAEAQRGTIAVAVRATLDARAAALGRELSEADVEPVTWAMVRHAHLIPGLQAHAARNAIHGSGRVMAAFMDDFDAILSPTLAAPPVEIGRLGLGRTDLDGYFRELGTFSPYCTVANLTGQPAMSVPLHWTQDGLPVGMMFAGRFGEEDLLLRLAAQLEAEQPWFDRVPDL